MANDNFKPTVDLRQNTQPPQPPARNASRSDAGGSPYKGEGGKPLPKELEVEDKKAFQKISRPEVKIISPRGYRRLIIVVFVLAVIFAGYWFFSHRVAIKPPGGSEVKWYMVKLADGEAFYGQIADTAADPVVIENVYYDYDQLSSSVKASEDKQKNPAQPANPAGQIRLVKRGKEAHGPSGSLDIVRSQVLYMEPLAADSKVLKAIVEYEKQNK